MVAGLAGGGAPLRLPNHIWQVVNLVSHFLLCARAVGWLASRGRPSPGRALPARPPVHSRAGPLVRYHTHLRYRRHAILTRAESRRVKFNWAAPVRGRAIGARCLAVPVDERSSWSCLYISHGGLLLAPVLSSFVYRLHMHDVRKIPDWQQRCAIFEHI